MAVSLVTVFALGISMPVCTYTAGAIVIVSGVSHMLTFLSLAFWVSVITSYKAHGIDM